VDYSVSEPEIYTRSSMTRVVAEQLLERHGSPLKAAQAIHPECKRADGSNPTVDAVRKWIAEAARGESIADRPKIVQPVDADRVNQILNVLDEANIPVESIGSIKHVKIRSGYHEVVTKGADGEPVITRSSSKNTALLLSPKWEDGPAWPVVQPAKAVHVPPTVVKKRTSDLRTVVVVPDTQIGFLRDVFDESKRVPIHDPVAIDVALQIVSDLQPNQIGYIGDFLDLPEMSRWLQVPEFWRTTQPAIDEGHKILSQFEAAAGPRERRDPTMFIAGNHDRRLAEYAVKNAMAAYGLRPANEPPESWPAQHIARLLRFEELGIEYVGEYPGGEWWITPDLVARHNPEGRDAYAASVIAGHTHRIREETFTHRTQGGLIEYTLYEIGCLASRENYPDKRSLMATRVPSNRGFIKHWAFGLTVVQIDGDGQHDVHTIRIKLKPDGSGLKAMYAGKTYAANYPKDDGPEPPPGGKSHLSPPFGCKSVAA